MALNETPTGEQFTIDAVISLTDWPSDIRYNIEGSFSWTGTAGQAYNVIYSFNLSDQHFNGQAPHPIPDDPLSLPGDPVEFGNTTQNDDVAQDNPQITDPTPLQMQDILNRISWVSGLSFEQKTSQPIENVDITFLKREVISHGKQASGVTVPEIKIEDTPQGEKIRVEIEKANIYLSNKVENGVVVKEITSFDPDDKGMHVVLHETLHASGLNHPTDERLALPQQRYNNLSTIMSTNIDTDDLLLTVGFNAPATFDASKIFQSTLGIYDIATMQFLYGVNTEHNSGDTLYTIPHSPFDDTAYTITINDSIKGASELEGRIVTLWDAGGIDTFKIADGTIATAQIDLRYGAFTQQDYNNLRQHFANDPALIAHYNSLSVVQPYKFGALSGLSQTDQSLIEKAGVYYSQVGANVIMNALPIVDDDNSAYFENAYGGDGNDTIFGNSERNILFGAVGQDAIFSGSGDENVLFGGADNDTFVIETAAGANFIHGGFVRDHADGYYQTKFGHTDWDITGHFSALTDLSVEGGAGLPPQDGNDTLSYGAFDGGVLVVYRNEDGSDGKGMHNGTVTKFAGIDAITGPASGQDTFYSIEKVIGNEGYQNRIFVQGSANIIENDGSGFLGTAGTLNFDGNFSSIGNETGNMLADLIDPIGRSIDGGGNTGADGRDILRYRGQDVWWNMAAGTVSNKQDIDPTRDNVSGIEAVAVSLPSAHATVIPYFNQSLDLRTVSNLPELTSENELHIGATDISYAPFASGITVNFTQSFGDSFLSWISGVGQPATTGNWLNMDMTVSLNGTANIHTLSVDDPRFPNGSSQLLSPVLHGTNTNDTFTVSLEASVLKYLDAGILDSEQPGSYKIAINPGEGTDNITANANGLTTVQMTYTAGMDTYTLASGAKMHVLFDAQELTATNLVNDPVSSAVMNAQGTAVVQITFDFGNNNKLELKASSSTLGLNGMLIEFADGSGYYTVSETGPDFNTGTPPSDILELTGTFGTDTITASSLFAQEIYALGGNDTIFADGRGHSIYGGSGLDTYWFTAGQGTTFDTFYDSSIGNRIRLANVEDPFALTFLRVGDDLQVVTGSGFIIKDYFNNPDTFQEVELDDGSILQLSDLIAGNNPGGDFTVDNFDFIEGTSGDDTFTFIGTQAAAFGLAGKDTFYSNFGDNFMDGGAGVDTLDYSQTGANFDIYIDSSSEQSTNYAFGDLFGSILGGEFFTSIETFVTADGNDYLSGSFNDETFIAGAGDDFVYTGFGNNTVIGGAGFDNYNAVDGTFDTISYAWTTEGVQIDLLGSTASGNEIDEDSISGFERAIGGTGADGLSAGFVNGEVLEGGEGYDNYFVLMSGNETTVIDAPGEIDGFEEIENFVDLAAWDGSQEIEISAQDLRISQDGNDLLITHLPTGSVLRFTDGMLQQPVYSVGYTNGGTFVSHTYAELLDALDTGGIIGGGPVNTDPVAQDDSFTGAEDAAVTGNVLADNGNGADSDADGDTLSVTPATLTTAQGGTVDLLANGDFTYTPAADFNGQDSFTYTVTDGNGGSDTGTVTLDLAAVNDLPVAAADSFTTDEDTVLSGNLLVDNGNGADSDVDGDILSVVAETITTAAGGTVDILANGDFTYTPAANFNGADSFSYTLDDGNGGTAIGNISLTVNPINDAPLAADDTLITDEDTAAVINVLSNDSDTENDTLSISAVTDGANGTVTHDGTAVTYTPNADFNGTDSFTYTVSDGNGGFDTATVNVTVNPVNDNPVAVDDSFTTDEDVALVGNLLTDNGNGADSDIDGDVLAVVAETVTTAAGGTVDILSNGDFTYTPAANFNGADSFSYTLDDGNGGTTVGNVSLNVNPINDAPLAADDTLVTDEDTAAIVNVLTNDNDVENDALSISAVTDGANGTVTHDGTSVTYTPNANFFGTDSFTYTVADGNGGFDTATVNVTVNPVNDNPVAADDSFTTDEDVALTGNLLADNGNGVDSDIDGDSLSVVAESVTTAAGGTVDILSNGDFTYTPAANFNGADSFSYTLDDGNGGTAVGNVSLTVNPVNDAPLAADDTVTTDEDTAAIVNVLSNDSDVENDTLAISAVTDGANGTVTHDGTSVTYTPNANFFGTDSFTYTISDGNGGFDTATVDVTVNPVNDNPVANDDTAVTDQDNAVVVDVLANDTDVENDVLSVSGASNGSNGTVSFDGTSVTYTPNAGFSGTDSFTYTVSDGNGGFDTATVSVTVNATQTNTPPVANDDDFTVEHGNALTGNLLVDNGHGVDSDADNDNLTVTAAAIMTLAGATVTILANGDFTYEGATGFVGTDSFEYTLEDGNGGFDTAFASITVTAPAGAIVGDNSDDSIATGIGSDTVFAGDGNNTVSTGSGDDAIYAGNGDDNLNSGSGDDIVYVSGGDNTIHSGSGNDTVTTGNGDDVIESGSGHDVISSGAGNDDIDSGSGDDIIYAGAGNDVIRAGSGDDFLAGGFGADIMTGGSGADTFYFDSTDAVDTITDFAIFDEDILHIADLLTGFDPLADALGDWANISESGSDSILSVDQDGLGGAFSMTQIALLQGETGLGTVDDLLASGHLVVV